MIMGLIIIIDAKHMDVSQPIWLSGCPRRAPSLGCPIKGHFRAKNEYLPLDGLRRHVS